MCGATSRDAASCELELSTLEEVQKGFEQASFSAGGQEIYGPLVDAVARTAAWLRARAEGPDMRPQHESGKRFEGVCGALEVWLQPPGSLINTIADVGPALPECMRQAALAVKLTSR